MSTTPSVPMTRSDIADMYEASGAVENLESDTGISVQSVIFVTSGGVKVFYELENGEMKARVRA